MKVLKFGGTSVGCVENILETKKIIENEQSSKVVVVVSAVGGITDMLIQTATMAERNDETYVQIYNQIVSKHEGIINGLLEGEIRERALGYIQTLHEELYNILKGVSLIGEVSVRTSDVIVSYGEQISSAIIALVLNNSSYLDSRNFIKTQRIQGKHTVDLKTTYKLIQEQFAHAPHLTVIPGFISSNFQGETTNLGRGGSDYTASLVAAALHAEVLEIWTDVDGFMTADPRIIEKAYVIEKLSYAEAMELSHFGAKVIYPPTIFPVLQKGIPIYIKNTMNSASAGSLISNDTCIEDKSKIIKGISSINDTCLVTMQGAGMVGVIGINYRLFKALADAHVSVFLVSQASSENSTSLAVKNEDAEKAEKAMRHEFAKEFEQGDINEIRVERNCATVAIVGENMKYTPGVAGKLFNTLGRNGINIIACAQGASEFNISFVIDFKSLKKAINVIHESFFLSDYMELNLFLVGVGTVGGDLVQQIAGQQHKLLQESHLKINVVGIANSRKMIIDREGLTLTDYQEQLDSSTLENVNGAFAQEIINMNAYNSVFIDCTASSEVANDYLQLLSHNIHVVTANKVAASSPYQNYLKLKQTAKNKGVKFLFETNVGAGLPIINTLNAMIKSGDKILRLEAVLSGTLNFIFNTISESIPFSQAIQMAMDAGYAEPDPRIDLSGVDVIRKLVILSRESGYQVEQSDVKKISFLPASCFEGELAHFWEEVKTLDADFEARRKVLESENKKWRFVAQFNQGATQVELLAVDHKHPFFDLEGSNNLIQITTERYKEYPLIIKGYGAGSSVTAAGVFSDIISIANP